MSLCFGRQASRDLNNDSMLIVEVTIDPYQLEYFMELDNTLDEEVKVNEFVFQWHVLSLIQSRNLFQRLF